MWNDNCKRRLFRSGLLFRAGGHRGESLPRIARLPRGLPGQLRVYLGAACSWGRANLSTSAGCWDWVQRELRKRWIGGEKIAEKSWLTCILENVEVFFRFTTATLKKARLKTWSLESVKKSSHRSTCCRKATSCRSASEATTPSAAEDFLSNIKFVRICFNYRNSPILTRFFSQNFPCKVGVRVKDGCSKKCFFCRVSATHFTIRTFFVIETAFPSGASHLQTLHG